MRPIVFVIAVLALGLTGWADVPESAGASPYQTADISVSDTTPAPGALVEIRCEGFAPNSDVDIVFRSTPIPLGSFMADATGSVVATVGIPAGASGVHRIEVVGVDPTGTPLTRSVTVTVAPSATGDAAQASSAESPSDLASTGWPVTRTIAMAAAAIALGAGLIWRARMRHRASHA